jgi:hypothetical protein
MKPPRVRIAPEANLARIGIIEGSHLRMQVAEVIFDPLDL